LNDRALNGPVVRIPPGVSENGLSAQASLGGQVVFLHLPSLLGDGAISWRSSFTLQDVALAQRLSGVAQQAEILVFAWDHMCMAAGVQQANGSGGPGQHVRSKEAMI